MSMDDSIGEFTKNLMARAKAREQILRQKDNHLSNSKEFDCKLMTEITDKQLGLPIKGEIPLPPPSPSEKENKAGGEISNDVVDGHESFVEEYNDLDEDMEDCSSEVLVKQQLPIPTNQATVDADVDIDQVLPLSSVIHLKGVSRNGNPPSASPVSRKGRLSVLANTINAWEDDLGSVACSRKSMVPQQPQMEAVRKNSRFSVSTPPPTNRIQLNKQPQRNSCHQFVRSSSLSPTKRIGSPSVAISSTHSSPSRHISDRSRTNSSDVSPEQYQSQSPVKAQVQPVFPGSPGSILKSSPLEGSGSPLRGRRSSPTKTVRIQSHVDTIQPDQEMKEDLESVTTLPNLQSPIKSVQASISSNSPVQTATNEIIKEDPLEKTLELQGFVRLQTGQLECTVPKVVSSMLKKGIFDKPDFIPTPKPIKKTQMSSSSCPPKTNTSSARLPAQLSNTTGTGNQSPTRQFGSRKSLQPDPSELTVAQKAKLFERQQQEQEMMRQKESDVAANLRKPYKRPAGPPIPKLSEVSSEAPNKLISPEKQSSTKNLSPEKKPQYYFGQNEVCTPPPPPPMPPKTPERRQSRSPSPKRGKASPWKRSYCEEDDEYQVHAKNDHSSENVSPSAQIAKSVKRIKVVKRDDKMYPSLTDIETTEVEETDNETNTSSVESSPAALCNSNNSSMSTSSLGSFIQNKAQSTTMCSEFNTTAACKQIDDLIDEALEGQFGDDDTFMMEAPIPVSSSSPIAKKCLAPQPPQPLMHSVSMYRKKQQQLKKSECEFSNEETQQLDPLMEEECEEDKEDVKDKIQHLEQQVLIQQKGIAQASKALNICESSFEFTNSTENVEGERVLLISTQKRSQLLSYISKLKHGRKDNQTTSPSKEKLKPSSTKRGSMRIQGLQLYPVKSARLHQDYVYHFIVILKHNDQVYATTTVKTSSNNSLIEFPNEFVIQELDPGFKIQLEVYALRTFKQIDVIPHHMKYHIKYTPSAGGSTPSKTSTLSHFLTPTRSSKHTPKATDLKTTVEKNNAAPGSIRTSNFTLQAVLNLNLSNLNNKTEWEMSMVNNNLILPNISMNIKCTTKNELSFKGFLTTFSDVSGLGAWHRRWAKIDQEYRLLFWTYPEDEAQDRPPVMSLSLSSCITPRIAPTPREMCARPNTFLLVTTREPLPTDTNSLVVSVHEKYTAIKHLISADNKMDRDSWIGIINKALTNMRAWGINNE